jgi:hypothetical protein
VRNVDHNGAIAPGGSVTFGFIGSGAAATPSAVTCART